MKINYCHLNYARLNRGFTLIELMVTISIIGMLSSVVFASLSVTRDNARVAAAQMFDENMYHAQGVDAVGIWKFTEGSGTVSADKSGIGSDMKWDGTVASCSGAVWSDDSPAPDRMKSLFFSGTGSNCAAANYTTKTSISRASSAGFTYSAWVKPTQNSTFMIFMGVNHPYFGINSGKIFFSLPATSGQVTCGAKTLVSLNNWHHVAATFTPTGNMNLYLDGKLDNANTCGPHAADPVFGGSSYVYLGAYTSASYNYFGYITDAAYYNRALGYSEIQKLYASVKQREQVSVK